MDLTPSMRRYRECARHVWNVWFQPMPDGWHEFFVVKKKLFSGLVLSQFEPRHGVYQEHPDGYYGAVAVVPLDRALGVPAMHARPVAGQNLTWAEFYIHGAIDLRFVDFFDWADYRDPHDYQWVECHVVGPPGHERLGDRVLLEATHVLFLGITDDEDPRAAPDRG